MTRQCEYMQILVIDLSKLILLKNSYKFTVERVRMHNILYVTTRTMLHYDNLLGKVGYVIIY